MHRPAGAPVTPRLGTRLLVRSCVEGRQAAAAWCLVVLGGSGLEQKDQYPPFPDEETEAWRGLVLAHVTWPWEIGRAELGGRLGVGMCVVAGPRPSRGGRRLLPGGEADSGGEPGWGRLLLLQAEAGRRHRPWRHQMLQSPSLQHATSAPRHPTPRCGGSGLTLFGHQSPLGTDPAGPPGGAAVPLKALAFTGRLPE